MRKQYAGRAILYIICIWGAAAEFCRVLSSESN